MRLLALLLLLGLAVPWRLPAGAEGALLACPGAHAVAQNPLMNNVCFCVDVTRAMKRVFPCPTTSGELKAAQDYWLATKTCIDAANKDEAKLRACYPADP